MKYFFITYVHYRIKGYVKKGKPNCFYNNSEINTICLTLQCPKLNVVKAT